VCEHLHDSHGLQTTPDRVLIVSGSQQAVDLVAKVLLDPGDAVVIENPSYLGAIQAFDAYQATYLDVATDDEGMIPADLDRVLRTAHVKPKLIYVIPNFCNPSGVTTSLERRRAIVTIAKEHGVPILEDDPYGRLRYSGEVLPSLASLADGHGVIYTGTASKIVAPGMRVAWLVLPEHALHDKVVMAKQAADLHTSTFTQRALHAYAKRPGAVDGHVAKMVPVYRARRDAMVAAIRADLPPEWTFAYPDGGLFLWMRAPEGIDTAELLKRALDHHVAFVPGAPFWVNRDVRNTLRLSFSNSPEAKIVDGVARLGLTIAETLATT
jgi:2-aminoadipate transaminase